MPSVALLVESRDRVWLFPVISNPSGDKSKENNKKGKKKKAPVPLSAICCPRCHEVVGNGNSRRENIYDQDGKEIGRRHSHC